MSFKEFNFETLENVKQEAKELGLSMHFSEDIKILRRKVAIGAFTAPNSLAIHPMEGSDAALDGSPQELTIRRYERFAKSGAGLIWFEAVAVKREGRASPAQLFICEQNLHVFQSLTDRMRKAAKEEYGNDFSPVCIMQLTHSGRFSKPHGVAKPIIACSNEMLDKIHNLRPDYPVISDETLEMLEEAFVATAVLAKKAGFDGVDVKACHRYLSSELLSAFTRGGKYGGSFEGRTAFLLRVVSKIKKKLGDDFIIASRLNIYDGIPYPYGWGVDQKDETKYDLTEPVKLVKLLYKKGVSVVNLTMGTPYYNPHINRPYDKGGYIPKEHPLKGVERLVSGVKALQQAVGEMVVVGTGYSWLRQFAPYLAAGSLEDGGAKIIGFGRQAFAYPEFARDMLEINQLKKEKSCITCGKCAQLLRAGGPAGCVVRDAKIYAPIYNRVCRK